jgi:hypothetical protein
VWGVARGGTLLLQGVKRKVSFSEGSQAPGAGPSTGQAGRDAGRQAGRRAGRQAGGQAGRQAVRHAGRHAGGQAGRQAGMTKLLVTSCKLANASEIRTYSAVNA